MPITQEIPRDLGALGRYFLLCQIRLIYWLPTLAENSGPFHKNYQLHNTAHIHTSSPNSATSKYHFDQHTMLFYDDYLTWFPIKPWSKPCDFPFLNNFFSLKLITVFFFFSVVSLLSCLYFRQSFFHSFLICSDQDALHLPSPETPLMPPLCGIVCFLDLASLSFWMYAFILVEHIIQREDWRG